MKRITVTLATPNGPVEAVGYEVPLQYAGETEVWVVHRDLTGDGQSDTWAVSHIPSGRRLFGREKCRGDAIRTLREVRDSSLVRAALKRMEEEQCQS